MTNTILRFFIAHISLIFIWCFTFAILLFLAFQFYFETNLTSTNLYSANLFLIIFFIIFYVFFFLNILKPFNFIISARIYLFNKSTELYLSHIHKKINKTWITKDLDVWGYYGEYKKAIYFMFYILPKIILGIALFIDIIYLNKIHYLYLILTILWVPLLFHLIKYILFNWAEYARAIVVYAYEIDIQSDDGCWRETRITPRIPEKQIEKIIFPEEKAFELIKGSFMLIFYKQELNSHSEKLWVKYLNLFIYTLFFIIWSYVLYLKLCKI